MKPGKSRELDERLGALRRDLQTPGGVIGVAIIFMLLWLVTRACT